MNRPEEFEDDYLTKIEAYCDWVEKLAADRSMECNALTIKLEKFNNVDLADVRLSFTDEKFRELFNELINAGRDMQIRDNLGNSYMTEDMYFKDIKARYSNEA